MFKIGQQYEIDIQKNACVCALYLSASVSQGAIITSNNLHISSQSEAYKFFNLVNSGPDIIDFAGAQTASSPMSNSFQQRFEDNLFAFQSAAYFLSDGGFDVGLLNSLDNDFIIGDQFGSFSDAGFYSSSALSPSNGVIWLLVKNSVTNVSEPGSLLLLSAGLAALSLN